MDFQGPAGVAVPTAVPPASSIFEPTWDRYGSRLAIVFGNHAAGGFCPYYVGTRCHHCDIGAGEGAAFDQATNLRRLEWFRQHYTDLWPHLNHLVLYNSGSILNRNEMRLEVFEEILRFASSLPALQVISVDSREHFIKREALIHAARLLPATVALRPILGLETVNDEIRNELLEKQMPRAGILRAFQAVGNVGAELGAHRFGLDVNLVIAGPGTTSHTVVEDAVETARFAYLTGRESGVSVDLNLHPYYPSARGRVRFPGHERCSVSVLFAATAALCELRSALAPESGLFVGWNDEAHDQEPDLRAADTRRARQAIDDFNRTQDLSPV